MKKKVCVVTSSRSEYSPIIQILKAIKNDDSLILQLIVGGGHLLEEQGNTYKLIEQDGFSIDYFIDFASGIDTSTGIAKSMGKCLELIADALDVLNPDLLFVVGDRYELLSICSAAIVKRIPIAHMSGGDITEGAIDNNIRNAVTMMADIHFPGNVDSAKNIERMKGTKDFIYNVGEPGLENLKKSSLLSRQSLSESLNLSISKKWVLCTLHPETKAPVNYSLMMARQTCDALASIDNAEIIIIYANMDLGGAEMNCIFEEYSQYNAAFHVIKSLGQLRYNSMMKECDIVVGNSSSGIFEAPFMGKPVVNIGNRQKGRHTSPCIINVPEFNENQIEVAIDLALKKETIIDYYYYGDGEVSSKVVEHIKKYLMI